MRIGKIIKGFLFLSLILLPCTCVLLVDAQGQGLEQTNVFVSGTEGYHTFRIPAVIATQKGTLLAFCEGRKDSRSDTGNIDLVLRRSTDNGETWGPLQIVADDGPNTIGNPCPVVDRDTGTIWLPLTRNLGEDSEGEISAGKSKGTREVWITKSTDDGKTWAKPIEITCDTKAPNWTWYATGPGNGIQLQSGRLLIPCDHRIAVADRYRSHVIYSDDHGKTWRLGGDIREHVNECAAVELADGSIMMNMRSYKREKCRAEAISRDGGITWTEARSNPTLIEPVCQASFIRYTLAEKHGKNRILFSNPASSKRDTMTVRLSYDEAKTWPVSKVLHPGPSAYSSLVVLPDMSIGCLYERGDEHPYETIAFARFTLGWLTNGRDKLN
ncbi:MAG: exo-alpha-sialidase [Thermoplasmata archaeon]|nr:MAG: exo-alpha-sialidase [Thermoplasmata archaeon]